MPSALAGFPGWARDAIKSTDSTKTDSRANYFTLAHSVRIKYDKDVRTEKRIRKVVRTLTAGTNEFSYVFIPLNPGMRVKEFRLWQEQPGLKVMEYDESVIKYQSITEESYKYYSDAIIGVVKIGSQYIGTVIAYEYEVVDTGKIGIYYDDIVIRDRQPVGTFELEIESPDTWDLVVTGMFSDYLQKEHVGKSVFFRASNLPYIPDEPYSLPWKYLAGKLSVSCTDTVQFDPKSAPLWHVGHFSNWENVTTWLVRLTDSLTVPSERTRAIADSIKAIAVDEYDLQKRLAEYAQKQIKYVAIEIGDGRFVPRRDSVTLKYKSGDCKDKTTLARSLFAAAGFETSMALVAVGKYLNPLIPSPYVFNHAIMAIRKPIDSTMTEEDEFENITITHEHGIDSARFRIAHDWTFFDPTDEDAGFGETAEYLKGRLTLIGDSLVGGLQVIPDSDEPTYVSNSIISAEIKSSGALSAQVREVTRGLQVENERVLNGLLTDRMMQRSLESALKSISPGARVKLISRECDSDSCYKVYSVEVPNYARQVGDEFYLKADLTTSREHPLLSKETRVNPIWFGPAFTNSLEVTLSIDSGFVALQDPEALDYVSDIGDVKTSTTWIDSNTLKYSVLTTCKGELVKAPEYSAAQEYERHVSSVSQQMIVLKRAGK